LPAPRFECNEKRRVHVADEFNLISFQMLPFLLRANGRTRCPRSNLLKSGLKTFVTERKTSVTDRKTLVTDRKTSVTERKTLVTERKTSVTERKTFVTDRKTFVTEWKTFLTVCIRDIFWRGNFINCVNTYIYKYNCLL